MVRKLLMKCALVIFVFVLFAVIVLPASAASVKMNDVPNNTYTYWNGKSAPYSSTAVYNFKKVLTAADIGYKYTSLTDISNDENGNSYVLDSESSSVFILDKNYKVKSSFSSSGGKADFTGAQGIEYRKGKIFVCDTNNERVLVFSTKGKLLSKMLLPQSSLIPEDFLFRPCKVGVDSSGYVYVLSEGSYYGAILYSPSGEFLGFYGSNTVQTGVGTALETIWENLTMTNEKRANSQRKLPYQFSDLYVDQYDFVYTSTGRTNTAEIEKGQIKRLNPGGVNVLDSGDIVFADRRNATVRFRNAGWTVYPNICSVIADKDGFVYCVDREASKIFIFDSNCNYISVMGGGNGDVDQVTAFKKISAIGLCGTDIIVLDEKKNNMVIMERTEYGNKFLNAQRQVLAGDYSESLPLWQSVIAQDRNNQLAYTGIAKAYLANKDYQAALQFAKDGMDYETYDQAKTYIRNDYLKNNFNVIAVFILVIMSAVIAVVIILRKKKLAFALPVSVKNALSVFTSPVDAFKTIKEKNTGSGLIATVLMALCYISVVAKNEWGGFQFIGDTEGAFNSALTLLKTIGAIVLFSISNWAVASLMQGRGTLKEIYIVTCYSLTPFIISNFLYALLSNFVSLSEGAFLDIMAVALLIYTGFIFVLGLMNIHDISFGRFLGITLLSLFGILVVVFVGIVVFMLAQQLYKFFMTMAVEIIYR
ncbi:MAG: YIP1 family protein [Clostridia bacterium]|nr:YIP1 family protein [Clostridia bacterium]